MLRLRPAHAAWAAGALALAPPAAWGQDARAALPASVSGVIACTPIPDPAARLACLDTAAATLKTAAESGELVILDRQQVRKSQRENFGRDHPAELPGIAPGPTQATFEVSAVGRGHDGHWVLVLKEGGRWRLTEDQYLSHEPQPGAKARISKGALGSYFIALDGGQGLRASRLD